MLVANSNHIKTYYTLFIIKDLIFKENLLNMLTKTFDSSNNNLDADNFDSNEQAILNQQQQDGTRNIVMDKRERSKACSFNAINCHRNFQLV